LEVLVSDIHYFPRYSSKENAATNNTLLLLLRLYQHNRYKFEKLMEILTAEQEIPLPAFGLQFSQQRGTGQSVLDGFLSQESIKVAVETKLGATFDLEQLNRHLAEFQDEQHKFLLLLSPSPDNRSDFQSLNKVATRRNIRLIHATFAGIVEAVRKCLSDYDEEMHALVDDYESLCSEKELLPRDEYTIFVPPCGKSVLENIQHRLYYCPVTRQFRNARYLGIYAEREIRAIGKITKIVACDVDQKAKKVKEGKDQDKLTNNEKQRILGAAVAAQAHGWNLSKNHKFFLCDEMAETKFRKKSPLGIMGHRYLDIQDILGDQRIPENLTEFASLLRQYQWK
jgi:hypothetical protein